MRRLSVFVLSILLLGVLFQKVTPALAQGLGFGLRPVDASKGYFTFDVQPGQVINDAFLVSNPSDKPQWIKVMAVGGHTAATGGTSLSFEKIDGPAAWIAFDTARLIDHQVNIPAGSQVEIPFTLTIPADVQPGEYAAGFLASPVERGEVQTVPDNRPGGQGASSFQVKVISQVGVMVMINVSQPGSAGCKVDVEQIQRSIKDGRWSLGLQFHNTGNIHFGGPGTFTLRPLAGGSPVVTRDFTVGYFIAGDTISYPLDVEIPAPGQYIAEVKLADKDFPACGAAYRETVNISSREKAQAVEQERKLSGQVVGKAWYEYPLLQAGILILGLALVGLVGLLFYLFITRRKKEVRK